MASSRSPRDASTHTDYRAASQVRFGNRAEGNAPYSGTFQSRDSTPTQRVKVKANASVSPRGDPSLLSNVSHETSGVASSKSNTLGPGDRLSQDSSIIRGRQDVPRAGELIRNIEAKRHRSESHRASMPYEAKGESLIENRTFVGNRPSRSPVQRRSSASSGTMQRLDNVSHETGTGQNGESVGSGDWMHVDSDMNAVPVAINLPRPATPPQTFTAPASPPHPGSPFPQLPAAAVQETATVNQDGTIEVQRRAFVNASANEMILHHQIQFNELIQKNGLI